MDEVRREAQKTNKFAINDDKSGGLGRNMRRKTHFVYFVKRGEKGGLSLDGAFKFAL